MSRDTFPLFTSKTLGGGKACTEQIHFIVCRYLSCPVSVELVNKVGRLFILREKIFNLAITLVGFASQINIFRPATVCYDIRVTLRK